MINKNEKIKMPVSKTIKHNFFMLKTVFSASPLYFILSALDAVRWHGMSFVLWTYGVSFALNAVEFGRDFNDVLSVILFIFGLQAISGIYSSIAHSYIMPVFNIKAEQKLKLLLYKKAKSIDLSCYDDPDYYNEFVLSVSESKNTVERTLQLLNKAITGLVMFLAYGTYFLVNDPVSVIFVFVSFIARFFFGKMISKLDFKVKLAETPFVRKRAYIHRVFYLNDYAKELRLNKNVSRGLYKDFDETNDKIYDARKSVAGKKRIFNFLSDFLFNDFIFDGIYLTYLVFMTVVRKTMSFSSLFILWGVAGSMRRGMIVLSELLPQAMENALYIDKIRAFLAYENKIKSCSSLQEHGLPVPREIKTIRFENVSFKYSNKQDHILKSINLTINPRDKIALVGYNGAGKTTLIKLLMRLYDPADGIITLDGIDIRKFNLDEYRKLIGTIFQDYRIYAATVEENIVMDLQSADRDTLHEAVKLSGFLPRLAEMSDSYLTPLTREFDESGTALSGGESQKLATARVFYKPSNLIILDEPSSALDPIAEYQMNKSMNMAAQDRSVVFISHRLSTTKHADKIFMLDSGVIIEEGTHEELLKLNGKYTEMWIAQASKYV
ncbi:MAG: ABC transporter ATP-binding protein/permease [Treponema sp.]|nr:ABC transporter ATP-binding protein/permease [Treponema sp.]